MTKRRTRFDALAPVPEVTWLVIRDELQRPLKIERIPPSTDLRMVMVRTMARSVGLGFEIEEDPGRFPVYFCRRGEQRREVSIDRINPAAIPPGHSSGSYAAPEPARPPSNVTPIRKA